MLYAKFKMESTDSDAIARALKPDDVPWVRCYSDGNKLIIEAKSEKTGAMLNALDDYLLNIRVANSLIELLNQFDC